ncbi:unnamed protein product [Strongylus vulgaris]|uniref:SHSP domain-containing protein n=1 Tax=Strongylus vulgaris TaxID=40348 RepID=A0A3P7JLT2_STRVU|nr:unnamed protein product [Strongylus vulgaris]
MTKSTQFLLMYRSEYRGQHADYRGETRRKIGQIWKGKKATTIFRRPFHRLARVDYFIKVGFVKFVERHFVRKYDLPLSVKGEEVKSELSKEGVLTVRYDRHPEQQPKIIPISIKPK